ncbi:MAG: NAD-dependent epimerase/dehydratase family protein [Candidatus Omnitrophica bacterium]|nr:NAD-dependent epimerase/dehydratase family protein [Candidatus Omnitrophota bacterium]
MKRVVVTGAGGFVGANLARMLLERGHETHLFVRPGASRWRLGDLPAQAEIHEVELADRDETAAAVRRARPEWIFHLAAHGAYSWQANTAEMVRSNIVATVNLAEACHAAGFESFVSAGSSSEYGLKDHAPAEDEAVEPNSFYAVTKVSATLYCRFLAQKFNLPMTTLRLYSVFGPYENPGRLIPNLIVQGLQGHFPQLTHPSSAHDFVYSEDVCEAFLAAAERRGGEAGAVYNVGSGVQTTLGQAVDTVRKVLGIAEEPRWGSMPERAWDARIWVADNRKIRAELGWEPRHNFEEGFKKDAEWFAAHPEFHARYQSEPEKNYVRS